MMRYDDEEEILLTKLPVGLFQMDNHNMDNHILGNLFELRERAVGWTYGGDVWYRPKPDCAAVMLHDDDGEYWVHLEYSSFEMLFLCTVPTERRNVFLLHHIVRD